MHKLARQKHILDRLSETGQLSISELVAELQVSADTIRRDLSDLGNNRACYRKATAGPSPLTSRP